MLASLPPFLVLLVEVAGMVAVTYLCGIVPLYLTLSKTKLRILEVVGAGLLVGASMTVVLPEGASALFSSDGEGNSSSSSSGHSHLGHTHSAIRRLIGRADAGEGIAHDHNDQKPFDAESGVGLAILSGFLLMFLIDQIASPGSHVQPHNSSPDREVAASSGRPQYASISHRAESMRLMRASSHQYPTSAGATSSLNGRASPRPTHVVDSPARSEGSPEHLPADHDYSDHAGASLLPSTSPNGGSGYNAMRGRKGSNAGSLGRDGHGSTQARGLRSAIASVAGLLIHAAADGIAMGASAGSGDDGLKIIVLVAIMIHKAPAAFGLCALLIGQRLNKSDIRRAIALFSLATPAGALVSYLFLTLALSSSTRTESAISPHHIGFALTFSAGTFMYVAMHAVHELASDSADIDGENTGSDAHHHHAARSSGGADANVLESGSGSGQASQRHILGRTARISVFVIGTLLPKALQSLVGHGH